MSEELKPCPFCGSRQVQVCTDWNNPSKAFARCRRCRAQAPLSVWNAAPTPPEPSAEAVEAVSKAICGDGWWVYAQGKARAALAADPLRKALGELVGRMSKYAAEHEAEIQSGYDRGEAYDIGCVETARQFTDELVALLEKHA